MVVMVMSKVPASLDGVISRFLFEVKSGIYVGHVSARVRDILWEHCCLKAGAGWVFQAWSINNEQKFAMRLAGSPDRIVTDWEGVSFITQVTKPLSGAEKSRIMK